MLCSTASPEVDEIDTGTQGWRRRQRSASRASADGMADRVTPVRELSIFDHPRCLFTPLVFHLKCKDDLC